MNNDRLKFRTPLTVTTYNDNDEEIDVKFMIYDISIYADFQCGLSWDSLMSQIKEQGKHLSDELLQKIEDVIDEWSYDDWVILETLAYPEQCTGLKDSKGNLIYEGDIIKLGNNIEHVKYSQYHCMFMFGNGHLGSGIANHCEVVGNIHENKEKANEPTRL